MATQVLLHIGTHKTGSSTIQQTLLANRAALARHGVRYVRINGPRRINGRKAADSNWLLERMLAGDHRPWQALRAQIAAAPERLVVVSAEAFEGLAGEGRVDEVRRQLADHDVGVVVYLRNQVSYLASAYRQRVKQGLCTVSFRDFAGGSLRRLDYVRLLEPWERHFGRDALHVRCFEAARASGGLVADFAEVLSPGLAGHLQPTPPKNVSPSDDALQVALRANRAAARLASGRPAVGRGARLPLRALREIVAHDARPVAALGRRWAARQGALVPEDDLAALRRHPVLAEWNAEFRRRWPQWADPRLFADLPA